MSEPLYREVLIAGEWVPLPTLPQGAELPPGKTILLQLDPAKEGETWRNPKGDEP